MDKMPYGTWNKHGSITTMPNNIPYDGAVDWRVFGRRQQENGINTRHGLVHLSNGPFVLEIGRSTQPSQHMGGTNLFSKLNGEPLVFDHPYLGMTFKNFFNPLDTLFDGKEIVLVGIVTDGNHYFIKQIETPDNNILMPNSKWVERTRKYCFSLHYF